VFVKICGITNTADALGAAVAGADAVGLNLIRGTPRYVEPDTARGIATELAGRVLVVGIVANLPLESMLELRSELGLGALQLHGSETPELLAALLPNAYKAVQIGGAEDVALAANFAGDWLLVDAKVSGRLGGTGEVFDWSLVADLARQRPLILAGGLTPENVALAVQKIRPWGVDTASGVEIPGDPRRKAADSVAAFVRAAKNA
jgi:phosphoribosylanthranilate isomerase